MTKKTRIILFLSCFLFFIIIAPLAIIYSQGYRIDFQERKISQTGGIFIKALPRQVEIYIDEKITRKTDFFFGSVLIENLLPKKHKIEVKKDGYFSWQKTLEVKEKEVIELKNIILFPKEVSFNIFSREVKNFWLTPDQRKIILKESLTNQEFLNENWSLKAFDLDKNIKSQLANKEDFIRHFILKSSDKDSFIKNAQIEELKISENSKEIYLEISNQDQIRQFKIDIDKAEIILFKKEDSLFETETEEIISYLSNNDDFYYLDKMGNFFKIRNNDQVEKKQLNQTPFPINQDKEYQLKIFKELIFIIEDKNVYLFNDQSNNFEIFSEQINSLILSPDNKKLAYFSNHEIWLLFLEDKSDPPQRTKNEKVFLIRLSEKINNLIWLNNDYLSFISEDSLKITEIDDRDRVNIINLFQKEKLDQTGNFKKLFFSQFNKRLYLFTENETLYQSSPLFP